MLYRKRISHFSSGINFQDTRSSYYGRLKLNLESNRNEAKGIRVKTIYLAKTDIIAIFYRLENGSASLHLKNAMDSIIQAEGGFIAVNLTLSTFPCTIFLI
jgi:hypothetical protein